MKRIKLLTACAVIGVLFTSCFGNSGIDTDTTEDTTDTDAPEASQTVTVDISTGSSDEPETAEPSYSITTEEYTFEIENGEITIPTPVFHGCDNAEKLTAAVRDYSLAVADNFFTYQFMEIGYYLLDCEITCQNDRFASFVFEGSLYADGMAHPYRFTYPVNADILSGELLLFKDMISDFDAVAEIFNSGGFSLIPTGNPDFDAELEKIPPSDRLNGYSSLYEIYPHIYFLTDGDGTDLVLSFEEIYLFGSFSYFRADIEDVKTVLTGRAIALLFD